MHEISLKNIDIDASVEYIKRDFPEVDKEEVKRLITQIVEGRKRNGMAEHKVVKALNDWDKK